MQQAEILVSHNGLTNICTCSITVHAPFLCFLHLSIRFIHFVFLLLRFLFSSFLFHQETHDNVTQSFMLVHQNGCTCCMAVLSHLKQKYVHLDALLCNCIVSFKAEICAFRCNVAVSSPLLSFLFVSFSSFFSLITPSLPFFSLSVQEMYHVIQNGYDEIVCGTSALSQLLLNKLFLHIQ